MGMNSLWSRKIMKIDIIIDKLTPCLEETAAEVGRGAVFVHIAESAPHNLGSNKQYKGVGGHLFAIAMKLSLVNGFGGYIYFDAKNIELVEHYKESIGANRLLTRFHEYRMEVLEEKAQEVIEKYTLEGDLDVK